MNELQLFNFENNQVRTLLINDEPWFVGKDVAEILGYSKARNAIATHVDDDDKKGAPIQGDLGGTQEMTVINESGVYALVFGSKLPSAKKFKHWVTSEVLPTLRKTGGYTMPKTYLEALKAFTAEVEKNEMLSLENKIQIQQINELKPKADYTDRILKTTDLMTTTQIAKDYGMSAKQFNSLLHDYKVQFKQNGQWLLYSQYQSKGYTSSETVEFDRPDGTVGVRLNTKWTQKGRLFLYGLLKKHDVVPTIERLF
ncbi:MAG: phage antirepressor [Lactobacillus johnsonii]|nr:phage antirepressor [Lactobacillus johnsonii]